jgi:hypothetical protein
MRPRGEQTWVTATENCDRGAEALLLETKNSRTILENCRERANLGDENIGGILTLKLVLIKYILVTLGIISTFILILWTSMVYVQILVGTDTQYCPKLEFSGDGNEISHLYQYIYIYL